MNLSRSYIVVGTKPWNRRVFDEIIVNYPGKWRFVRHSDEIKLAQIIDLSPRYIFFLHWSTKVQSEVYNNFECVGFHMTDLPFGRGGSPLQNLIARGYRHTKLSALRLVEEFDAGPIYLKEDLCLEGNAEEIFIRASDLSAQMIKTIIDGELIPVSQAGESSEFKRRTPKQSEIAELSSLAELHDLIRMQDADGYPPAFIEHQGFKYDFRRAALYDGRISADVTITAIQKDLE